jgi:hypothetical protein
MSYITPTYQGVATHYKSDSHQHNKNIGSFFGGVLVGGILGGLVVAALNKSNSGPSDITDKML